MSDLATILWIPFSIAVFVLIIEYWIVQPIRNAKHKDNKSKVPIRNTPDPLIDHLRRLIRQLFSSNTYRLSSTVIRNVGDFISLLPLWLISSFTSLFAVVMSLPLYLILYSTEKFSLCRYFPSCKEYLVLAIEAQGSVRGLVLGVNRFARCNRQSKGGHDAVSMDLTNEYLHVSILAKGNWKYTLAGFAVLTGLLIAMILGIIVITNKVLPAYLPMKNIFIGYIISTILWLVGLSAVALIMGWIISNPASKYVFRWVIIILVILYWLILTSQITFAFIK